MTASEAKNVEVVRRYFEGCNSGHVDVILSTLAQDVVHYFLPHRFPPIRGAEHLARYWRKFKNVLNPVWSIDHIVAQGDEVISEWSCIWTSKETQERLMMRGSEWYILLDGRIAEVRAYFIYDDTGNTELTEFPYVERGYLPHEKAST